MVIKNLLRRAVRSLLTIAGIAIGGILAIIVALVFANLWILSNLPMWLFVGLAVTTAYQLLR